MKDKRECYVSENCNVYCGFPGGAFTKVERDDMDLPQDIKEQIQNCVNRNCEQDDAMYEFLGGHLRLPETQWNLLYERVLCALQMNDIQFVEIVDVKSLSLTVLACNNKAFEHGFLITFLMDPNLTREMFYDRMRIHELFSNEGFAPPIIASRFMRERSFVVMEKPRGGMLGTLMRHEMSTGDIQMLGERILEFVSSMCGVGFSLPHLSIHQMGYRDDLPIEIFHWQDITLQVIDFQYVFQEQCDTKQTIESLVRSLDDDDRNMSRLGQYLLARIGDQ